MKTTIESPATVISTNCVDTFQTCWDRMSLLFAEPVSVRLLPSTRTLARPSRPICCTHFSIDSSNPQRVKRLPLSRRTLVCAALQIVGVELLTRCQVDARPTYPQSAYDIAVQKDDKPLPLAFLKGKVALFVNVASYCALTPQYEGLVALHNNFRSKGFEIVASPCDQFGHQEPGSNESICEYARDRFGAKFLLLDKLQVNDSPGGVSPLYQYLKANADFTGRVSWNFEKFLVDADGHVLRRYKPGVVPSDIRSDLEFALTHPGQPLPPRKKASLGVE